MSPAEMNSHLDILRSSLSDLVAPYPAGPLFAAPLTPTADGANAPTLGINLQQQLLLSALNPYMARVLGLYFVDDTAAPGVEYDYCIIGYWGSTRAAASNVFPGAAPGAPLARGWSRFNGMTICSPGAVPPSSPTPGTPASRFWRWTRDGGTPPTYQPHSDPTAPPLIQGLFAQAVNGIAPTMQPDSLLGIEPSMNPPPSATTMDVCHIQLARPMAQVTAQLAGDGVLAAYHAGAPIATQSFNSTVLTGVTLTSPDYEHQPIDEIRVLTSIAPILRVTRPIIFGMLTLHLLPNDGTAASGGIGTLYRILHAPQHLVPLAPPATPVNTFRHRAGQLDLSDPANPTIVARSLYEVVWDAPAPVVPANPDNPMQWPAPHQPVGFRAQRWDTGTPHPGGHWGEMLRRFITTASQPKSPSVASPRIYRLADNGRPDPVGGWAYRIAGFDPFGALGRWSTPSNAVGSQRIAAAPYRVRIRRFDNSASSGGAPSAAGDAWIGGALTAEVAWSGASFLSYPDLGSARLVAESINGSPTGAIYSQELILQPPTIDSIQIANVSINGAEAQLITTPALPIAANDPPGMLLLYGTTTTNTLVIERYAISAAEVDATHNSVTFTAGNSSRLVNNPGAFQGKTAYFIRGYSLTLGDITQGPALSVPIGVPITQNTARGRILVRVSSVVPFDPADQIVDPNNPMQSKPQPPSPVAEFLAQQWLIPQQPPAPNVPVPTHTVHHEYYDPADYYGSADISLPDFSTPNVAGVSQYHLYRAAVPSVANADVERRLKLQVDISNDGTLSITESGGTQRADLQAWINSTSDWLTAYNVRLNAEKPPRPPLAMGSVLNDDDGRRAFIEHFYNGLLDDELRALADIPDNIGSFAPARAEYNNPGTPLADTITAVGATREIYKLLAANAAGSQSAHTISAGPYYSRSVLAPDAPTFIQVAAASSSSVTLFWSLSAREDIVGYLVFRADSQDQLTDLRFFGTDPTHALGSSKVAQVLYQPGQWPPLGWEPGAKPRDPRIIALVPEPRLFARDYDGSDMAEVVLPAGTVPDTILGVYRQGEYGISTLQNQPGAFNYWIPPSQGGISQLVKDSATQARVTGLRVGLGFSVPVVVVVQTGGTPQALGTLANAKGVAVRMASYTDPSPHTTNFYRIVALDVWGNRSSPSPITNN
ncbi:MAG: fibronectin type III domain-containing protein [Acidiferrobacterales bacterium]